MAGLHYLCPSLDSGSQVGISEEGLSLSVGFIQLPDEIHQLPSSSNAVLSLEEQINENRKTVKEKFFAWIPINIRTQDSHAEHQSIADFDLSKGWRYPSCPHCNKKLSGTGTNYRCIDHDSITSLRVVGNTRPTPQIIQVYRQRRCKLVKPVTFWLETKPI